MIGVIQNQINGLKSTGWFLETVRTMSEAVFSGVDVNAGGKFKFAVMAVLTKPGLTVRTLIPEFCISLRRPENNEVNAMCPLIFQSAIARFLFYWVP